MAGRAPPRKESTGGRKVALGAVLLLLCFGLGYAERDMISAYLGDEEPPQEPLRLSPPVGQGDPAAAAEPEATPGAAADATEAGVTPADTAASTATDQTLPATAANPGVPAQAETPGTVPVPALPQAPSVAVQPVEAPELARPALDDSFAKPAGNIPAPAMAPVGPMVFTPPKLTLPAAPNVDLPLPAQQPVDVSGLLPKAQGQTYSPDQGPSNFQGQWSGTYEGADEGSFTIRITDRGVINGSGTSDKFGVRFPLFGTVRSDGSLNVARPAVGLAAYGVQFSGEITPTLGKGAWSSGAPLNVGGAWQMRRN